VIARHSFTRTTLAHLLPGLLALVVYVPAAAWANSRGLPAPLPLFLTMLVVLLPCELGLVIHARRADAGSTGSRSVVPYTERLPVIQYLAIVPLLLAWSFICFFILAPMAS